MKTNNIFRSWNGICEFEVSKEGLVLIYFHSIFKESFRVQIQFRPPFT